jgi:hypothetical protein
VTTFLDSLGMISYLQIIHFIAIEPTVKRILSIKISIFYTSAVVKLLQQKYKLQKDAVRKRNEGHF